MRLLAIKTAGNLYLMLAVVFLLALDIKDASGQEELLTQAPAEYRIFGVVNDQQGEPIPNATASLVTLPTRSFQTLKFLLDEPPTSSADCEEDGAFDIRIPGADARWSRANDLTDHLLIIKAPGCETSITKFRRDRMLVDFPMDISLDPCASWKLKALDQDGSAVSDLQIKLAQVSGIKLPFKLDVLAPAKPLGDGIFEIHGVTKQSLEGIFLSSEARGNFRMAISSLNGEPIVRLPKTGTVKGSFQLPKSVDPSEIAGEEVVITGGELFQRDATALTPLSWSIHLLDDNAKATSTNTIFSKVTFGLVDPHCVTLCGSIKDLVKRPSLTEENSPLEISRKLHKSKEIKLRFVDGSGEAISTVQTSSFSIINAKTDSEGIVTVRLPVDDKPAGQLFPFDTTGQYLITSPTGVKLDRIKMVDGKPEPIEMTRSRSIRGRVTDEQGQIVAGAKVDYTIQSGGFTGTNSVRSNQLGDFEINGLPADTNVSIKASFGNQSTPADADISVTSGQTEEVSVPVVAQPVASMAGTVTDQNGAPIVGAVVKLFVANTMQAEGYSAERLNTLDLIPNFKGVRSDENGRFHYPPTTQFKQRILVMVTAKGYRDLRFPFIAGSQKEVNEETIALGKFSLSKLPTSIQTTVAIKDQSGQPVEDAKLVFLGIDSEKQIANSDENGIAKLKLVDTRQLVAVKAKGYRLKLAIVENIDSQIDLTLQPQRDKPDNVAWLEKDWKPFHEQAGKLLEKLEVPKPKESTFYRQSLFLKSQLNADFDTFQKNLTEISYEHRSDILMFNAPDIFLNDPEESVKVLIASPLHPERKASIFSQFALLCEDEELKEEIYGEAIIEAGKCSGTRALLAVGQLAASLVIDGKIDVAKELVGDAWDSADELQAQLKSKEIKARVALSRVFATVLGLVDADAAIELIRLTASEFETQRLSAQCLLFASLAGDQDLDAICKKNDVEFGEQGLPRSLMAVNLSHARYDLFTKWIQKQVQTMPDSVAKVEVIMLAARHMPAGSQQSELLGAAVSAWEACDASNSWIDPATKVLAELPKFESLSTADFDALLFASLEHAPTNIDSFQLNGVFANLVRMVAIHDPQIARQILDLAFENGAWLYGDPLWSAFENNSLLMSYAWIDPELAAQKAVELSDKFSEDDDVRKLQLLTSVINELNSIAVRKGMLR